MEQNTAPDVVPAGERSSARARRHPLDASEVVAGVGVAALVLAALLPDDRIDDGPVICPFRHVTSLPCPGCGLTRSWVHLMHGDVPRAFADHAFGPLLAVLVVVLAVLGVLRRVRGREPIAFTRLVRHPLTKLVVAAWLVWAVVRLALAI